MPLSKVSIGATRWEDDSAAKVLHADEPHALVMAAGYLKYSFAKGAGEGIYFRGQRKLYGKLEPTLFRGLLQQKSADKRIAALAGLVDQYSTKCGLLGSLGEHVREPLLQHYGISTTWLDLVDNVWVALWFACHQAKTTGNHGEFWHFERRIPSDSEKYAYILLVATDLTKRNREKPGYFTGTSTELVDLRMAAPSVFLRPHAQHGLLFRKKGGVGGRPVDYSSQIRGIIRVDLAKALHWLGEGKMVGAHSLFPPPYYDNGYQILLATDIPGVENIGRIAYVGA